MSNTKPFLFHYTIPVNSFPAFCQVQIIKRGTYGKVNIAILTELPNNSGMSVTNACEYIATKLCQEHSLDPGHTIFIDHYPKRQGEDYSIVSFSWNDGEASDPDWIHLPPSIVPSLFGVSRETLNSPLV